MAGVRTELGATAHATPRPTAYPAAPVVLRGDGLSVRFAGLVALDRVEIDVLAGEILGLIGPNGAGKTTLINALTGFQRADGRVFLDGVEITDLAPHRRARLGVRRSFQNVRLFADLAVFDNVFAAALAAGWGKRMSRRSAMAALEWAGLADERDRPAGSLPYGSARWLSVARTLVGDPRVILIDEPAAGLNEEESAELGAALARVPGDFGASVLVIEHDVALVMGLCHRIHVLDNGATLAVGTPSHVRQLAAVRDAYFGADQLAGRC
jgi:branched-chain amino acid transport system ATP-binding protein